MEAELKAYFEEQGYFYVALGGESLERVYRLFFHDEVYQPVGPYEHLYHGTYYQIKAEEELAQSFFQAGAAVGCGECQYELLSLAEENFNSYKQLADQGVISSAFTLIESYSSEISLAEFLVYFRQCLKSKYDDATSYRCLLKLNPPNLREILWELIDAGFPGVPRQVAAYYLEEEQEGQEDDFIFWASLCPAQAFSAYVGQIYVKRKMFALAETTYQAGMVAGCLASAHNLAGRWLDQTGHEESLRCLMSLVTCDEYYATTHLISYYSKQENYSEMKYWTHWVLARPTSRVIHVSTANYYLGLYYLNKAGQINRGLTYLHRASNNNHTLAKATLIFYYMKQPSEEGLAFSLKYNYVALREMCLEKLPLTDRVIFYLLQIPNANLNAKFRAAKRKYVHSLLYKYMHCPSYFSRWIVSDIRLMITRYLIK